MMVELGQDRQGWMVHIAGAPSEIRAGLAYVSNSMVRSAGGAVFWGIERMTLAPDSPAEAAAMVVRFTNSGANGPWWARRKGRGERFFGGVVAYLAGKPADWLKLGMDTVSVGNGVVFAAIGDEASRAETMLVNAGVRWEDENE